MDLTTTYLGLNLRTPIVPSAAAPLSEDIDNIKRLEDAGRLRWFYIPYLRNNYCGINLNCIII